MSAARDVVERYLADGQPVYGLTTGLGARVVESIPASTLADFSRHTVRGRANSVGPPLPTEVVRAAMLVRANGLAQGGSGARPELADALIALLERGVHPVVPVDRLGSAPRTSACSPTSGSSCSVRARPSSAARQSPGPSALEAAGLSPLVLAPKDGLALISANAVSAAFAALALADGRDVLEALQVAAALSLEGFRASSTPLDERVVAARPAPGQAACAARLRELLAGSSSGSRRLQDPLSLRCVSQTHGSLLAALDFLAAALDPELNGAGDNPLVLADDGEILSTGNFFVPALALAAGHGRARVRAGREPCLRPCGSAALGAADRPAAEPGTARLDRHRTGPAVEGLGRPRRRDRPRRRAGSLDSRAGADEVEDASTGAPLATGRLSGLSSGSACSPRSSSSSRRGRSTWPGSRRSVAVPPPPTPSSASVPRLRGRPAARCGRRAGRPRSSAVSPLQDKNA